MAKEANRRIIIPTGQSITDPEKVDSFLAEAQRAAHPNARELLANIDLTPESVLAATAQRVGLLEVKYGAEWDAVRQVRKKSDIELSLKPEGISHLPSKHAYYFLVQTEDGPVTIEVEALTDFSRLSDVLWVVRFKLEGKNLSEDERRALEAKRDELELAMKLFIIQQLSRGAEGESS